MKSLKHIFEKHLPGMLLLEAEPMARHTTFRIGGPADLLAQPSSEEELLLAMKLAEEQDVPVTVVGNGSNLLVRDGGIRGLVLLLGERFSGVSVEGEEIFAQAGATLAKLSAVARRAGLAGLEFASGIPGTLGGGVAMNAGAYGGQLSDALVSASVLEDGAVRDFSREDMQMGYRTTRILKRGGIVLSARFRLTPDAPEAIGMRMRELNARRREKQPLELPSAGSTFKRPEGYFAGALIEGAGLKGVQLGGAMVSVKHAGFVVNVGGATARDVLELIVHIRKTVRAKYGVELETEIRVLGED